MFRQLGDWMTTFLSGYVAGVVTTLAAALIPIALVWLTVYIANYGFSVARGEAQDPFSTFAWKMVKMTFILSFALSAARFMDVVFSTADGLQDSMSTIFIKGATYGDSAPTTVFGALDAANDRANELLKSLWKDASIWRLDLVIASIIFSLGTTIFLAIGTIVTIMSKVILAFAMAVGPISILALMFKPTSKFFDAWLSTVLSAVVLAWFVFFALGLSFYVVQQLLDTMTRAGAFTPTGMVNAIESAVTYLTFMVLLAVLLWHAPHYASALTGGAAVQTGGQLAAGYIASKLLGRSGASGASAATGAGGGSLQRGAGAAYLAGRAVGATADAAATVGSAAARGAVAAYQRVARRGNRL
jgi:type IV secretion system protein VirB6